MTDKRLAITAADLARIYRDLLENASRNWRHTPGGGPPLILCEAVRVKLGISQEDYDEEWARWLREVGMEDMDGGCR